jgi:hypothetical protein
MPKISGGKFAKFGEDFGEAIRKTGKTTAGTGFRERATKHFQVVLSYK